MTTSKPDLLGPFVRLHREKITPTQAGLTVHGRRRTPGLRREELAQLCAVSTTWITWIEQGRPVHASAAMLNRLSEVLQLSAAERTYLFNLAGRQDPSAPAARTLPSHAVLQVVHALDTPAYVLDRYWNALAWNKAASAHFVGWLDKDGDHRDRAPNLLEFMFKDPTAPSFVADWESRARRLVAEFRADVGKHLEDPALERMIRKLCASSRTFSDLWSSQDVVDREGGHRVFHHPVRGPCDFEQTTLIPATSVDLKLVILLPV